MKLIKLPYDLSVCKLHSVSYIDFSKAFLFVGKTEEEISLVCPTSDVPSDTIARLRLYCLRLSDKILILGNGGIKSTRTYNEDSELNGYVLDLQQFDALLKEAEKDGSIRVEETSIIGSEDKIFEL